MLYIKVSHAPIHPLTHDPGPPSTSDSLICPAGVGEGLQMPGLASNVLEGPIQVQTWSTWGLAQFKGVGWIEPVHIQIKDIVAHLNQIRK